MTLGTSFRGVCCFFTELPIFLGVALLGVLGGSFFGVMKRRCLEAEAVDDVGSGLWSLERFLLIPRFLGNCMWLAKLSKGT